MAEEEPRFHVFDANALIAACSFAVRGKAVAEYIFPHARVAITPAVYNEVVTAGGHRHDALLAKGLLDQGQIELISAHDLPPPLDELKHYNIGDGDRESIIHAHHHSPSGSLVSDDFLVQVVALRLGIIPQLFLDFIVQEALDKVIDCRTARELLHAVEARYPRGFVAHSLDKLPADK